MRGEWTWPCIANMSESMILEAVWYKGVNNDVSHFLGLWQGWDGGFVLLLFVRIFSLVSFVRSTSLTANVIFGAINKLFFFFFYCGCD